MSWLQSRAVKRLGYSTDVITIVGLLAGAVVALETRGHEWGAPVTVIRGGLAGWLVGYGVAFAIRRALSRPCPGCGGKGKVFAGIANQREASDDCARCGGAGRIV